MSKATLTVPRQLTAELGVADTPAAVHTLPDVQIQVEETRPRSEGSLATTIATGLVGRLLCCCCLSSEARGRLQSCVASVIRMALCVMKLMPILDLVTDFATFQTYMMQGWYELALVIFGIILATWRFLTVYSALTPKPTPGNIAIIYMPGALHLFWERLTFDGDEDEMAKRAWKQEPAKAVVARQRRRSSTLLG